MRVSHLVTKVLLPLGAVAIAVSLLAAEPRTSKAIPGFSDSSDPDAYAGQTLPSEKRQLSLRRMEVVKKIYVKPGDRVTAGQVLLEEQDNEELARLKVMQFQAKSEVAIQASKASHEYKVVEFERYTEMLKNLVANQQEWDKARIDADMGMWDAKKAVEDRDQKVLEVALEEATIQNMRIISPIDGIVQEVSMREGEVVDPQKTAIVVVKNDPLWVEVFIPSPVALKLKKDQELKVIYTDLQEPPRTAKVIFLDPVADAAGKTQLVRLEMPNPEGKPAGLPVQVIVPAASTATAARDQ